MSGGFCQTCGESIDAGDSFCRSCGTDVSRGPRPWSIRSLKGGSRVWVVAAVLLAFFIGASLVRDSSGPSVTAGIASDEQDRSEGREGDEGGDFGQGESAEAIVARLRDSGLPVAEIEVYDASSDPNELLGRPGEYLAKANFADDRVEQEAPLEIDTDEGGSVEVFASEDDASRRAEYVRSITEGGGPFNEYSYLRGAVFLRVTSALTPEQADAYHEALRELD